MIDDFFTHKLTATDVRRLRHYYEGLSSIYSRIERAILADDDVRRVSAVYDLATHVDAHTSGLQLPPEAEAEGDA